MGQNVLDDFARGPSFAIGDCSLKPMSPANPSRRQTHVAGKEVDQR